MASEQPQLCIDEVKQTWAEILKSLAEQKETIKVARFDITQQELKIKAAETWIAMAEAKILNLNKEIALWSRNGPVRHG